MSRIEGRYPTLTRDIIHLVPYLVNVAANLHVVWRDERRLLRVPQVRRVAYGAEELADRVRLANASVQLVDSLQGYVLAVLARQVAWTAGATIRLVIALHHLNFIFSVCYVDEAVRINR